MDKDLAVLEQRMQEKLEPYAAQLALLDEIPGVDWTLAAVIIAELKLNKNHLTRNLVRRPERLGFSVTSTFNNKRPSRRGFSQQCDDLRLISNQNFHV